jgi:outer membrane receptor protein involved in Fe transport
VGVRGKVARRLLLGGALIVLAGFGEQAKAEAQPAQAPDPPPTLPAASSQPAPAPSDQEQIVITGSRIPRHNLTAVSPVAVVTSEEVKQEGAVLTETVINRLPQTVPDQGLFLSNGSTGTATVNLRGFGAGRTLVLINGRRLLPGDATYAAPDINFVPAALIKRVEVLTGGASSVYGSDAVAGVVNFILDSRLQGLRVDGQASFYQHDNRNRAIRSLLEEGGFSSPSGNAVDGGIEDINAAYGTEFAHGRGHMTAYAGYRRARGLTQDARDYSSCSVSADDPVAPPECGGSLASGVGTFGVVRFGLPYHATADRTFEPGIRFFNFAPYNYYQRPDRRYTAGIFADFELSDAVKPYLEIMFMDDRTVAQIAPSGDFGATRTINCDNPLLSQQQRDTVCFDGNYIGQVPIFDDDGNVVAIDGAPTIFHDPNTGDYLKASLAIQRRSVEGGARVDDFRHRDLRAVAGFKGEIGRGLSYDASYLYGRVRQDQVHTNDLLTSRIARSLDVVTDPASGEPICRSALNGEDPDCVPWDVFAVGAASPAAAAYLEETTRLSGEVTQRVATASVTADLENWGILSPWAEQAPGLNVGAEYRKDKLSLDPDEHFRNADVVGLGTPLLPLSGSTSVKELFGELRVPVITHRFIESLVVEGGYRLSWYRNAESRVSSSSWKIGGDLSPVRGIRIRASEQRAVRAPNVQELFALNFADNFINDPCTGLTPSATFQQCAASGVTDAQYGHILAQPDTDFGYNGIGGGNAALKPETATTRAIGLVLEPRFLRGFTLTADWFDIKLKGAVGVIGSQTIVNTCIATADPIFCGRIHRDASGSLWLTPQGFVDNTEANIGALKTSGVDVGSSYTRSLGRLGSASVTFEGTWTRRFVTDNGGLSTPFDCSGLYGAVCGFPLPRWRHNLRGTWTVPGGSSVSLLWRHVSSVPVDDELVDKLFGDVFSYNSEISSLPAQNYFDLTMTAQIRDRYQVRLGVRNLFDRQPPIVPAGSFGPCSGAGTCNGNTYPQLYDPLGRFIFVGATFNL